MQEDNTVNRDRAKTALLRDLARQIAARAGDSVPVEPLASLARLFYRGFPAEDLAGVPAADLYGFICGACQSLQDWDGTQARLRLFNPGREQQGWDSRHTVVEIIVRDMPFLLDSTRGELHRSGVNIHKLHGQNFSLERSPDGRITAIVAGCGTEVASLLYFEIDCCSAATREALAASLAHVLQQVDTVVADFPAVRAQLAQVVARVEADTAVAAADRRENSEFLQWLSRDHIAFLGYECLAVDSADEQAPVTEMPDARLGLLRHRSTSGPLDLQRDLQAARDNPAAGLRQLTFSRSRTRSRVHRFAYPDYIEVNQFDGRGRLLYQHRFMGLYTFPVYTDNPASIPVVRRKINAVIARSGLDINNRDGRELVRVLELFPRDELFRAEIDELYRVASAVNHLQERRQVRLFARSDAHGKFFDCLVYMPRDRYTTATRLAIQRLLCAASGAQDSEFTTWFSESVLVRVHFVLLLDPAQPMALDLVELEQRIAALTQSWQDHLRLGLLEAYGDTRGAELTARFGDGFPAGYRELFEPRIAVEDVAHMLTLDDSLPLATSFYRAADATDDGEGQLRLRIFHRHSSLPLSDVLPVLENLGLRVVAEHPYGIRADAGELFWIQDFRLHYSLPGQIELEQVRDKFTDAFARIWFGEAESDSFNRLLLGTQLNWREIALLRAYAHYLKQINFGFSTGYIAETLAQHLHIAGSLVELFLTPL